MLKPFRTFFFIIIISLFSCKNEKDPLIKTIAEIESSISKSELKEFIKKEESIAVDDINLGYGIYFRNENLRNSKDSTLIKYFYSLNIYHLEDMSRIVFSSLHRKLKKTPIDLEGQLKLILAYRNKVEECNKRNILRGLNYYSRYNLEDTIKIRMAIDENNAIQYSCPNTSKWKYDDTLDMLITGTIIEKSHVTDTIDMFFKLKVLSLNKHDIQVLSENINVGGKIEVDLKHDIIEDIRE